MKISKKEAGITHLKKLSFIVNYRSLCTVPSTMLGTYLYCVENMKND